MDEKNKLTLTLRHSELLQSELGLKIENFQEICENGDQDRENLTVDLMRVQEYNNELAREQDKFVRERDCLVIAVDKILVANKVIEDEIGEMLQYDDAIKESLELRDRKMSPVIQ